MAAGLITMNKFCRLHIICYILPNIDVASEISPGQSPADTQKSRLQGNLGFMTRYPMSAKLASMKDQVGGVPNKNFCRFLDLD